MPNQGPAPRNRVTIRNMFLSQLVAAVAALAVSAVPSLGDEPSPPTEAAAGSLGGQVLFDGGKPPKGVVLTDTVIYLTPAPDEPSLPSGDPEGKATDDEAGTPAQDAPGDDSQVAKAMSVLDQEDITFTPHVLVAVAGEPVQVRNSDTILHNVHTESKENASFNRAQLPQQIFEVAFEKPEVIHVRCDVHSQMSAYVVVVPNRYFARADAQGAFTISDIAPGHYHVTAWHEKYGPFTVTQVDVQADQTVKIDVNFQTQSANH